MEHSIIGFTRGEVVSSSFEAVNPVTGVKSGDSYAHASSGELETACALANEASPILADTSGLRKAEFLECVADRIEERVEDLVQVMTFESGLPEPRVRAETGRTCGQLRMFGELVRKGDWVQARIDRAQPERKPLPKPDLRSMLRPVGPVAVFCASNFPLAYSVAGGDSASAWAAGCPVIVKAHHAHPGTALVVAQAVVAAVKASNFPEGTFSMLYGDGRKIGRELVMHPFIKAVGFTGSRSGGRALFDLASSRVDPIPVFAEMSSVNPVFVLPGLTENRLSDFVSGLAGSATLGNGQFCTNPGIVFHPDGTFGARLVSEYVGKVKDVAPCPMLHRGIRQAYGDGLDRLCAIEGVEVAYRADFPSGTGACDAGPCVATVSLDDFLRSDKVAEEVFGPSTLLVSYPSVDQLHEVVQNLEGQLTTSLFGEVADLQENANLIALLKAKAGRMLFNQFPTGVEVCGSIVHGGPYPATTDGQSSSVGERAIYRFVRPVCFQGFPNVGLPDELKDENPLGIDRIEA